MNLEHLDFLTGTVAPPRQAGHTTYQLRQHRRVGVLWVYANHLPDGSYQRTGGGTYDPEANTYGQGAYDADDIARAAVVYLRHWAAYRDLHSREQAYQLLRGLTYLQTASGPHAGNVVLWMQPDGTLNPSPTPKDSPDPSDSAASYWLARTIWALGEGYAAFRTADPAFAGFLRNRIDLAVSALHKEVLSQYGRYQNVDGLRMPAWLIGNGADASSEAVFGLASYVQAGGGGGGARTALQQLANGIAEMGFGTADTWPYGAILPSATSRSMWHAWGAEMATALAQASAVLQQPRLLRPAVADAAIFTPHLLTATGPDNGWLPTPVDGSQIAYGADSRVRALVAVSRSAHSAGLRVLAGFAAGWFFGQNPANAPTYDPLTGVTYDGVSTDGVLNLNSGAESTIHGLLTMELLDAHLDLASIARASAHIVRRDGQRTIEAESAQLSGAATVVHVSSAWTGESQWSAGAYVQLHAGSQLFWTPAASAEPRLLQAVLNRVPGPGALSAFTARGAFVGQANYGGGGPQGVSPAPGALLPITVRQPLPTGTTTMTASTLRGSGQLDAIQVTPLLSSLTTSGIDHGITLVNSVATSTRRLAVTVPGAGPTLATSYDKRGRFWAVTLGGDSVDVAVPAGGFAIALR